MRTSFVVQLASGLYLAVSAYGDSHTTIIEATRFPTNLLAERYGERAQSERGTASYTIHRDARPPHASIQESCRQCGCTDRLPPPDNWTWAEPGLCSVCAKMLNAPA